MRKFIVTTIDTTMTSYVVEAVDKVDARNRLEIYSEGDHQRSKVHGGTVLPLEPIGGTSMVIVEIPEKK